MKLTLTTNDGEVLNEWEIERDFGDLKHNIPRNTMVSDIVSAFKRQKNIEEMDNGNPKR